MNLKLLTATYVKRLLIHSEFPLMKTVAKEISTTLNRASYEDLKTMCTDFFIIVTHDMLIRITGDTA